MNLVEKTILPCLATFVRERSTWYTIILTKLSLIAVLAQYSSILMNLLGLSVATSKLEKFVKRDLVVTLSTQLQYIII